MSTKIHKQAMEHYKASADFYSKIRLEAKEDLEFLAGKQWEESQVPDDRLRLTVPLVASFLRHITNEVRKNKPAIVVSPSGQTASTDKAQLLAGMVRAIEQKSDASSQYAQAFWYAAAAGEGYLLVDRDYTSPLSFDQELCIKAADDPSRILIDPYCSCLDGEDSNWAFVIQDLNKEFFKLQFPDSKLAKDLESSFRTSIVADWEDSNTVRVARYFVRETKPATLYLIKSSDPYKEPFVTTTAPESIPVAEGETLEVLAKRPTTTWEVKEYLLNGVEVLSETTWPCSTIPIRRVLGDHYYVNGLLVQHGAVRLAKDPQKMYNWNTSVMTELIDMAPKSSFVAASGQIQNNPEQWANANTVNYGTLTYEPTALNGQMVPPPQRISAMDAGTFQAVASNRSMSLEDIKLVFGVQDASLGRQGNEISGVAILARQEQAGHSNYHYYDNLCASIRSLGALIVELIPAVYDAERQVTIVKPDDSTTQVTINDGRGRYDLSTDEDYEVTISTGPAYGTQRQEAVESMTALIGAYPNAGPLMADILVGSMDWPEAQRVAKRLKAAVPPEIRAATGEDQEGEAAPAELLAQVQQQLSELTMKAEKTELELQETKAKLNIAEDKAALELTRMDQQNELERLKLLLEEKHGELETQLKLKEYTLHERELSLKEKEMELRIVQAANQINEQDRPRNAPAPDLPERNIGGTAMDVNLGGRIG